MKSNEIKWNQMKSNEYSSIVVPYLLIPWRYCESLFYWKSSWGILGHPGALCTFFYTYLLTSCLVTNNVFKVHDPRRTNVAPPTRQSRSGFTWDLELQKIAEVTSFDHPAPLLKRIRHASCKPTFHRTTGQIASAVYRSSVLHISQLTLSKAGSHFS